MGVFVGHVEESLLLRDVSRDPSFGWRTQTPAVERPVAAESTVMPAALMTGVGGHSLRAMAVQLSDPDAALLRQ